MMEIFGVTLYTCDIELKLMTPARKAVCESSSSPWKKARTAKRRKFHPQVVIISQRKHERGKHLRFVSLSARDVATL
jgi:hypothetical protein